MGVSSLGGPDGRGLTRLTGRLTGACGPGGHSPPALEKWAFCGYY